jgi:hypothetical protein
MFIPGARYCRNEYQDMPLQYDMHSIRYVECEDLTSTLCHLIELNYWTTSVVVSARPFSFFNVWDLIWKSVFG